MAENAHHTSALTYILNWAALVVLALATFLLAKADLGSFQVPVAMLIAVVKGGLVVVIFMHLLEHKPSNRIFFIVAFLFIVLLVALTTADVSTRPEIQRTSPAQTAANAG
jgi:cytochrome c oxidase subunit IV